MLNIFECFCPLQVTLADVQAAAKKLSNAKLSVGAVGNLANVPYSNAL